MDADVVAVSGESTAEEASPQQVLLDVPCAPVNPDPTALSDLQLWFDLQANKFAAHKAKIHDALHAMGHLLLDAKKTFRYGDWLRFLRDPRVGLHERDAQRMMRISRQVDGKRLAALGISKATILLERFRKLEDRQTFIDDHGDLAQIPERDLRAMLKRPGRKKPPKPASVVPAATGLESLPHQLGELREHVLEMNAYEAGWIPFNSGMYRTQFRDLPGWAKFVVLGMFIATPSVLKAAQHNGPLQMALDVSSETAIDAALERMTRDARDWLLARIESKQNVLDWWNQQVHGVKPYSEIEPK